MPEFELFERHIRLCWPDHHHGHHRQRPRAGLTVRGVTVFLTPELDLQMQTNGPVGTPLDMSLAFFDQNGAPMNTTPTPDAAPAWASTDTTVDGVVASDDGMTAVADRATAGTATITMSLTVNGQSFTATVDDTVEAVTPPEQVLTSVEIVAVNRA